MSSRFRSTRRFGQGATQRVKNRADELEELPKEWETWAKHEEQLRHLPRGLFLEKGILEKKKIEGQSHIRLSAEAVEIIERQRDRQAIPPNLPCGHSGFVNKGSQKECKTCGETFSDKELLKFWE